jgi:phosphatidylglycerol:prolipoprotein diacylglycerol transferase
LHPILFDFGTLEIFGRSVPIVVGAYGTLFALGIIAGWLTLRHLGRQLDPEASWTDIYFLTILGGVVGGRLTNILIFFPEILDGRRTLLGALQGGGVWLGGVLSSIAVLILLVKLGAPRLRWLRVTPPRTSLGKVFNAFFVAVPLGHAIGRLGCFLGGCCWGARCDLPWAVSYTDPVANQYNGTPLNDPRHPTVLYESGLELVNFAVGMLLWRRRAAGWVIFAYWMGVYGIERFFLEFLRDDPRGGMGGISTSQWIGLFTAITALLILYWNKGRLFEKEPAD